MLSTYRELPFVLVGDSGQMDPWIYAELIREHPGRVRAVFIRRVGDEGEEKLAAIAELAREVREAGSEFVLAKDSREMARHAVSIGLLPASRVVDLVEEKVTAEEPPELGPELVEDVKETAREAVGLDEDGKKS